MNNPAAQRLWAAARERGGSIMFTDVSEDDIAHGRANGWLTCTAGGHFGTTEELRRAAAAYIISPSEPDSSRAAAPVPRRQPDRTDAVAAEGGGPNPA
jgi:hypothetical protein